MRYEWNELLTEEELMPLTEEALGPVKRAAGWKRLGALAACLLLVVCLANMEAIATGVDRLWRYVSGVGAVPDAAQVLVQAEKAELVDGERVYRVVNAYQQDGLVHLTVEVLFYGDEQGTVFLAAGLTSDGKRCLNYEGERFGTSDFGGTVTQITDMGQWSDYFHEMGYGSVESRYDGARAMTGSAMTFQAGEGDEYQVDIYCGPDPGAERVPMGSMIVGSVALKLAPSEEQPAQPYTTQTRWGGLTALVSGEGKRVQLVLEQPEEETLRAVRLWPRDLRFVDELGNRYPGVPIQLCMDQERQTQEIEIEREPEAPIVAIEIPSIEMMMEDAEETSNGPERFSTDGDDGLDWIIELDRPAA